MKMNTTCEHYIYKKKLQRKTASSNFTLKHMWVSSTFYILDDRFLLDFDYSINKAAIQAILKT